MVRTGTLVELRRRRLQHAANSGVEMHCGHGFPSRIRLRAGTKDAPETPAVVLARGKFNNISKKLAPKVRTGRHRLLHRAAGSVGGCGRAVAEAAVGGTNRPVFVDANAVSPRTMTRLERIRGDAELPLIDGGIVDEPPKEGRRPRFYLSGPRVDFLAPLEGQAFDPELNRRRRRSGLGVQGGLCGIDEGSECPAGQQTAGRGGFRVP